MKKALITGITGQDGSYLTELLLEKDYQVHGVIRRRSSFNTGRIDHLFNNPDIHGKTLFLHYGDLTDSSNLNRLLEKTEPEVKLIGILLNLMVRRRNYWIYQGSVDLAGRQKQDWKKE